jgi:hypothetical protein
MLPSRENLCKLAHLLTFQGLPILLATAFSLAQLNATTIWVASGSNANWNRAANWSNGVPTANDDVVIGSGSETTSDDNIGSLSLDTLTINSTHAYQVMVNSSGVLTIQSTLTLDSGSSLTSAGTLRLQGGGTISGSLATSGIGALTLNGTFNVAGGSIINASGASLTLAGATLNSGTLSGPGAIAATGTNALDSVINSAALTVRGGTTTFAGGSNSGTLASSTGPARVLNVDGSTAAGAVTNSGSIVTNAGTVNITGTINNGSGGQITQSGSGSLTLNNASVNGGIVQGAIGATGTNTLTGVTNQGTLTLTDTGTTTFAGGANSGTLASKTGPARVLDIDGSTAAGAVTNSGAIMSNAGTVNITGTVLNYGTISQNDSGTVTITGTVNNGAGGQITQSGSGSLTLNNASVSGGSLSGTIDTTGATSLAGLTNNGTVRADSGALLIDGTSNGAFTNDGTIRGAAGSTVTVSGTILNNNGTIRPEGGTVRLEADITGGNLIGNMSTAGNTSLSGVTNADTLSVASSTELDLQGGFYNNGTVRVLNGGTLVFADGASVHGGTITNQGSGVVLSDGSVALDDTNLGGFDLTIQNGMLTSNDGADLGPGNTIAVDSGATLAVSSGDILNNGGTLTILAGGTADPTDYTQFSGTLHLGGTLDVDDAIFDGGIVTGRGGFSSDADVTNNGVTLYVAGRHHVGTWSFADYTQGADGTIVFNVNSPTSFDQLILSGAASLAGTFELNLGASGSDDYYDVLLISADSFTGFFSTVDLPDGFSLVYQQDGPEGAGIYLEGQAPEPATGFLLLAGLCGAGIVARRRSVRRG